MNMSEKPKVAFYWCASCGGCEESVVDLAEDILMVAGAVDIVFWPVAMDFKKSDVLNMPDRSITASFINGAIRTSEQEEMARLIRRKSQFVIAYGSCAHLGGIPSLANQFSREQIFNYVYQESPSVQNEERTRPALQLRNNGYKVNLPEFRETVRKLDQVIDVDFYLPGCAPTPKLLKQAVLALLSGQLPPIGSVLAPDIALCDECPRKETKPTDIAYTEFKRPHEIAADDSKCLLAQGIICMGPATRGGCEALCVKGNMPCTGCFGPTSRCKDQGAKILSSVCSAVAATDEKDMEKVLATIPDPVGTFYRYGLAGSLLRKKIDKQNKT
jgi:F420-non-reducing hydrogenase small subunit